MTGNYFKCNAAVSTVHHILWLHDVTEFWRRILVKITSFVDDVLLRSRLMLEDQRQIYL